MLYFLYCFSKALATSRKKRNDPDRGRDPQVKNHCLSGTIVQCKKYICYFVRSNAAVFYITVKG